MYTIFTDIFHDKKGLIPKDSARRYFCIFVLLIILKLMSKNFSTIVYFYHTCNDEHYEHKKLKKFLALLRIQVCEEWHTQYKDPFPEIANQYITPEELNAALPFYTHALSVKIEAANLEKHHLLLSALDSFAKYCYTYMSIRCFLPCK